MNILNRNDYILRGVELALVLLLIIMVVNMFRQFGGFGAASIPPKAQSQAIAVTSESSAYVESEILREFDFFHRNQEVVEVVEVTFAPETNLNLQVFGMRADLKGASSSAIIQTPDMKQSIYYIGDEIIPGVVLSRVDIDYVILDRNGVSERLSRQGRTEEDVNLNAIIKSQALSYKATKMIQDLRFYPHREGAKIIGYRVMPRRGSDLESYGFKRNDIITTINGVDMTQSKVNLVGLWDNMKLARYATIQVLRDDVLKTIEVNLQ